MTKQNILQEVKNRMKALQDNKAAQLETIRKKQDEARTQIEAAALGMKQATEEMNVDAYEEAKGKKRKAQTALDMYSGRYEQIRKQEYISEAESDSVVDSLLEYENGLATDFKKALTAHLKQLAKLHKEYVAAVKDTEGVLTAWQQDIHANYRSRGSMTREDPITGERTDRFDTPVPVHRMTYDGCIEAHQLGNYLEKAAPLMAAEDEGEEG